ncbi:hypothetical protein Taro_047690 [Colocasia esculenta]|uniref:Uncharacterized protein n=1 Tax=Colocasia esculenta TaxID=4460 RepID=A0A843X7C8_COLES|nr:hypothetical protein [Colocasia esculenta]
MLERVMQGRESNSTGIFGWISAPRTRLEPLGHSLCPQQYAFKSSKVIRLIIVLDSQEQYNTVGATRLKGTKRVLDE